MNFNRIPPIFLTGFRHSVRFATLQEDVGKLLRGEAMHSGTTPRTAPDLADKVEKLWGIPKDFQYPEYSGRKLELGRTLRDYNIREGSTVFQKPRLGGGGSRDPMPEEGPNFERFELDPSGPQFVWM